MDNGDRDNNMDNKDAVPDADRTDDNRTDNNGTSADTDDKRMTILHLKITLLMTTLLQETGTR